MSYKLKSLTLENLVVYKNRTTIDFSSDSINIIEGAHTAIATQSNGAGKSLILDAISLALFGKGIRAPYITDYMSTKDGGIYIGLELQHSATNSVLKIERWRRPKSSTNKAKVWLDNTCISEDMTVTRVDELVLSHIGITSNNFLSCIFSVMIPGFLKLRPAQRFEILEQALAIKKMDSVIKKITTSIKDTQDKLDSTTKILNDKFNLLQTEKAKQELYKANSNQLKSALLEYQNELAQLSADEVEITNNINSLQEIETALDEKILPQRQELNKISAQLEVLKESQEKVNKKMNSTLSALKKKKTSGVIECVVCKSELSATSKDAIKEHFSAELAELVKQESNFLLQESATKEILVGLLSKQDKCVAALNLSNKKLKSIQTNMLSLERNIEANKSAIKLSSQSFDKAKLTSTVNEVSELNELKKILTKDLSISQAWKQALSKNGLRLAYIKEEIHTLSALASRFATAVYDIPMQVMFEVTEEQDVPTLEFSVNGRAGMFSTGEARRLEIAMTLSLLALLKSAGLNLNFLLVDEPIDGLSAPSKAAVQKVLQSLSTDYQIVMISHDPDMAKVPGHVIRIEYDNTTGSSSVSTSERA